MGALAFKEERGGGGGGDLMDKYEQASFPRLRRQKLDKVQRK